MTRIRGVRAIAIAAVLLVVVTGCAAGGKREQEQKHTPTATQTPRSDQTAASDAAINLVRHYYKVRDELRLEPTSPLNQLKSVAVGVELSTQTRLFERERRDGLRQTGETRLARLEVDSVSLDNSDPKSGRVPTVRVDACYDVSDVNVLDKSGHSVVRPDRPATGWIRYSVANYKYGSDRSGSWRVASSHDLERTPCDAS